MDISFQNGNAKFNYRACAVILHEGKILAMRDERSPYFYLPGGRVQMGETAEQAVLRELAEELWITARIVRPLWLNQGFFQEDVDGLHYHELCLYFLVDVSPYRSAPPGATDFPCRRASASTPSSGWPVNNCSRNIFTRFF